MILYPAIDIRGGHAVRLTRGDYDRETVFDADPVDAATRWVQQGARALHVVDLDGARQGAPVNIEHVERICSAVAVPVQVGGGLRRADDVDAILGLGAARVVLGTAALSDPALIEGLAAEHGDRVAVSADARGGKIAVDGWERETGVGAAELVADLAARGVRRFVYTPVEVDGTLEGPGLQSLSPVAEAAAAGGAELIYSGGIGTLDHLRALAALGLPAVTGVIVGRALYDGAFDVEAATEALSGGPDLATPTAAEVQALASEAYAAIDRRDLAGFLSIVHTEVEFRSLVAEAEGRVYHGHAGVREWWERVAEALGGLRFESEAISLHGTGAYAKILVTANVSGVEVPQTMWQAFRLRDGKPIWWATYRSEAEARAALELGAEGTR